MAEVLRRLGLPEIDVGGRTTAEPSPRELAEILRKQPRSRHSLESFVSDFLGRRVPSRNRDGSLTAEYQTWMYRLRTARAIIEHQTGQRFRKRHEGRTVVYELPPKEPMS